MIKKDPIYVIVWGFALTLALMLAINVIGVSRMAEVNQRLEFTENKHNAKVDLLQSMRSIMRERSLSVYSMYLTKDVFDREAEYEALMNQADQFILLREKLNALGLSEAERFKLDEIMEVVREAQARKTAIVNRIRNGNRVGLAEILVNEEMLDRRKMLSLVDDFIKLERTSARAEVAGALQEQRSEASLMLLLGGIGLIIGALVAWYVVQRTRATEAALFQEKKQAEVTLHSIGDAVISIDSKGRVLYLNSMAQELTGWTKELARGKSLRQVYQIIHEGTREPLTHPAMLGPVEKRITSEASTILLNRSGKEYAVEDSVAPIRDNVGKVSGAVLVFRNVTEARQLQKRLMWQASHDPLTGLINRYAFEAEIENLIADANEAGTCHALLYLDLDQFKVLNDTCGHIAGDELLRQLAVMLAPLVRSGDTFARLGGDEFGILLENCLLPAAEQVAEKLRNAVSDFNFVWRNKSFRVSASAGLVLIDGTSKSPAERLSAADNACYVAKDQGRNRIWVHLRDDVEVTRRRDEMKWVSQIDDALREDRFLLYFQRVIPVADAADALCGELLVRLLDEKGGIVSPMAFIPAAERYGLMHKIDRWVISHAFQWLLAHPKAKCITLNLSGQSLADENLLDFVETQLKATKLDPTRVCFEITETAAIANLQRALKFINALRSSGCRFALDDFGSGMSSFAYLKSLPIDFLKIDGAFVRDMATDPIDYAMVEAINTIGHVMGLKIIAEFVENDEILKRLRTLGVDYAQGYGIHKPEPLNQMSEMGCTARPHLGRLA